MKIFHHIANLGIGLILYNIAALAILSPVILGIAAILWFWEKING